jgi:hypothetical protein
VKSRKASIVLAFPMIGCSALAQSPIEAASVPADEVTPRFADLVLLVNPRSSAHATCQYMILRKSGHSQAESAPNLRFHLFHGH